MEGEYKLVEDKYILVILLEYLELLLSPTRIFC